MGEPTPSCSVTKVIWSFWLQGRANAPPLVQACLSSWERNNPEWQFRCLDATTIERYVPLRDYVDLNRSALTAASLSDVLRILLLGEFGGVWVDATLYCNKPLDPWLPGVMSEGFFAFATPDAARPVSSWFLAALPDNDLVASWRRLTVGYWSGRERTDDHFWFHHIFRAMCEEDPRAREAWARVPKRSAAEPHALQVDGRMFRPTVEVRDAIDWTTVVFKLTHRLGSEGIRPGSLLHDLLHRDIGHARPGPSTPTIQRQTPTSYASLKVSTDNLGDHIQIIAGLRLLSHMGVTPTCLIDRDDEIGSAPMLDGEDGPVGIILNGWFKYNRSEWPPHPKLVPLPYGFHARPSVCPELLSDESVAFFRRHQPIGCRDVYTEHLLGSKGIDVFVSHCLTLTLPRRIEDAATQTEVFVVSRDRRIENLLPPSVGPYTFVSHHSCSTDFAANMRLAEQVLESYRSRAKLIVTTLLHCALPAIAMGIPVIVFYPLKEGWPHISDRERFSSLERLVRIYALDRMDDVDWTPKAVPVSELKLRIIEGFYDMAARWGLSPPDPVGPVAATDILPPPSFRWRPDQAGG